MLHSFVKGSSDLPTYDFVSYTLDFFPNRRNDPELQALVQQIVTDYQDMFEASKVFPTHPELIPYLEKYIALKGSLLDYPVNIYVLHSEKFTRGICDPFTRNIFITTSSSILKATRDGTHPEYRIADIEKIVLHELGHCDLNRHHENSVIIHSFMQYFSLRSLLGIKYHHYTDYDATHFQDVLEQQGIEPYRIDQITRSIQPAITISEKYTFPNDLILSEVFPDLYLELFEKRNAGFIPPDENTTYEVELWKALRNVILNNAITFGWYDESEAFSPIKQNPDLPSQHREVIDGGRNKPDDLREGAWERLKYFTDRWVRPHIRSDLL